MDETRYVPEPTTGCWLWTGSVVSGYGRVRLGQRVTYAHRWAWEFAHGPIPDGLSVCHRCDTPSCVNPDHLFVGTTADNIADRHRKGRDARGSGTGHAKLTASQAEEIRVRSAEGQSQRSIAHAFGISQPAVLKVIKRRSWKA